MTYNDKLNIGSNSARNNLISNKLTLSVEAHLHLRRRLGIVTTASIHSALYKLLRFYYLSISFIRMPVSIRTWARCYTSYGSPNRLCRLSRLWRRRLLTNATEPFVLSYPLVWVKVFLYRSSYLELFATGADVRRSCPYINRSTFSFKSFLP